MNTPKKLLLSRFDYQLPRELISQKPIKPRDSARLLILDKQTGQIEHKKFYDIVDYLHAGDVLVLNDSKVIPARFLGKKTTGGKIEIFLLKKISTEKSVWQVLIGGKINIGQKVLLKNNIQGQVIKKYDDKSWLVKFNCSDKKLLASGQVPLPPYIKDKAPMADYQTVYAKPLGSVAAPTAGLHFTKNLITRLKKKEVKIEYLTLHVGLGTFLPVKTKYIQDHKIHSELAILSPNTAKTINQAKKSGHKIIAVGTTSARALEAFTVDARRSSTLKPQSKWVDIFIYPGYKFKIIDGLITNFHLPQSTLLMLVSALASEKLIKKSYQAAIEKKYKFFSFGDAMFIK